ncbi:rod shape-determining protein MreC [bacterium]|nr:rod shape-determining protein MreC [bacterium]
MEFLRRHSLILTSLLLFVSSLQLMSASVKDPELARSGSRGLQYLLAPVQALHHGSVSSFSSIWNRYIDLVNVEVERTELAQRLKALEAENSRLLEFESENKRLRELLTFSTETGFEGATANVIGHDALHRVRSITIDKGRADGIDVGLAVVDGHGIIGQTIVATDHSARVLLLTDSTSAVDAIVQGSRAPGIAEGDGLDKLRLRYVLKEYPIAVGDRVIASGFGGIFPKGTLLGVVSKVDPHGHDLFQEVEFTPSVDLNRLETVMVILPTRHPQASVNVTPKNNSQPAQTKPN